MPGLGVSLSYLLVKAAIVAHVPISFSLSKSQTWLSSQWHCSDGEQRGPGREGETQQQQLCIQPLSQPCELHKLCKGSFSPPPPHTHTHFPSPQGQLLLQSFRDTLCFHQEGNQQLLVSLALPNLIWDYLIKMLHSRSTFSLRQNY